MKIAGEHDRLISDDVICDAFLVYFRYFLLKFTCRKVVVETTAPIPTKFCTLTKTNKYSLWVVQIHVKQIQDGGRPPSWKIKNRPYLRKRSTDLLEICYGDAYSPYVADQ